MAKWVEEVRVDDEGPGTCYKGQNRKICQGCVHIGDRYRVLRRILDSEDRSCCGRKRIECPHFPANDIVKGNAILELFYTRNEMIDHAEVFRSLKPGRRTYETRQHSANMYRDLP